MRGFRFLLFILAAAQAAAPSAEAIYVASVFNTGNYGQGPGIRDGNARAGTGEQGSGGLNSKRLRSRTSPMINQSVADYEQMGYRHQSYREGSRQRAQSHSLATRQEKLLQRPDLHSRCHLKPGGSCLQWEGLTCQEVDSILQNVQRYETSYTSTSGVNGVDRPQSQDATNYIARSVSGAKRRMKREDSNVRMSQNLPTPRPSSSMVQSHSQRMIPSQGKPATFPGIDAEGHISYRLGDGLEPTHTLPRGRYKILRSLGSGTYGKVVECWDRQLGVYCAVKVVRAVPKYRNAAKTEVKVLEDLRGEHNCVKMLRAFDYQGHMCLAFELLGPNLYEIMRATNFRPFSVHEIRLITRQVLESLCLVHGRGVVHTDVKPENILFVEQLHKRGLVWLPGRMQPRDLRVKLVDFGSAVYQDSQHASVVSTRHYRAPEIILKLGWSYPCDLWSMGCILVELFTGEVLFGLYDELDHLTAMERVLGPIPLNMLHQGCKNGLPPHYMRTQPQDPQAGSSDGVVMGLNWPGTNSNPVQVEKAKPLEYLVRDELLQDLIRQMLRIDPRTRITANEALQHPFFAAYLK